MTRTTTQHVLPHDVHTRTHTFPDEQVDIATLDLSFISVLLVIGAVTSVIKPAGGQLVVLIKPQFEAGRGQVGPGGVVRDPKVRAYAGVGVGAGVRHVGLWRVESKAGGVGWGMGENIDRALVRGASGVVLGCWAGLESSGDCSARSRLRRVSQCTGPAREVPVHL